MDGVVDCCFLRLRKRYLRFRFLVCRMSGSRGRGSPDARSPDELCSPAVQVTVFITGAGNALPPGIGRLSGLLRLGWGWGVIVARAWPRGAADRHFRSRSRGLRDPLRFPPIFLSFFQQDTSVCPSVLQYVHLFLDFS
jgi:hypothetical protein